MILIPDVPTVPFVKQNGELTDEARLFLQELINALREFIPQLGNQYI